MLNRCLAIVLAIVLVLGLAGCQSISDKIGEEVGEEIAGAAIGGDVEVDGDTVTVEGEDGAVTVEGGGAGLPDGFPDEYPLYDAELDSASSVASNGETIFYVNMISTDDVGTIYDWHKSEFGDGWNITSDVNVTNQGEQMAMITAEKDAMSATVSIADSDTGSDLGIILTVK